MHSIKIKCNSEDKIAIYGAGAIANILYLYLSSLNLAHKIICFLVSDLTGNPKEKYGIEVVEASKKCFEDQSTCVMIATQTITHSAIIKRLRDLGCKDYECINDKKLIADFYDRLYQQPIQNNKILFIHMKGLGYGGNPKYIAQKLIELYGDTNLDLVWAVSEEDYSLPKEIRTVKIGTMEYYQEVATSHIWIDNTRKTGDIRKRKGQFYIQTWHGSAPFKKVELDVIDKLAPTHEANSRHDSQMANLFLSGSEFYTKLYRRAFWYDGEILKVGLPRQDVFWQGMNVKNKVYDYYGINKDIGFVLYAPTFRKNHSVENYDLDIKNVLIAFEEKYQKKFICGVSKHPDIRDVDYKLNKEFDYIEVDRYPDFEELLMAADILITDYSGCMYDYSYTERPIFLYQKDYLDYINDRDFYISMNNLPYVQAFSNEEIINKIASFDEVKYKNELRKFMNSMGNYDDGTASEKVAKYIMKIIQSGSVL